jgi:lysophospholipase L1-like esterase
MIVLRRVVCVALFGGLIAAALPRADAAAIVAAMPISRMDLPWWRARFEQKQAEIRAGRFDVIYYGDSITQKFEKAGPLPQENWPPVWQRFYGDRHAINLGFIGDTTASLLWRLDHGEGDIRGVHGAPRVAILLIGANDLGRPHWSATETLAGIEADVNAIHAHLPQTKVLLLGVLPSDRSAWVTETTRAVNKGLAQRYGSGGDPLVTYVDAGKVLLRDGRTDDALFIDKLLTPPDPPLHPTAQGATLVAEAIEPTLAALLGDRKH